MSKSTHGGHVKAEKSPETHWSEVELTEFDEDAASFHIELAECVETKTVTTTTTTKRSYPPLLIRAPQPLETLDTKQYPLARKPTPHEISSFSYELDGEVVHFREECRLSVSVSFLDIQNMFRTNIYAGFPDGS